MKPDYSHKRFVQGSNSHCRSFWNVHIHIFTWPSYWPRVVFQDAADALRCQETCGWCYPGPPSWHHTQCEAKEMQAFLWWHKHCLATCISMWAPWCCFKHKHKSFPQPQDHSCSSQGCLAQKQTRWSKWPSEQEQCTLKTGLVVPKLFQLYFLPTHNQMYFCCSLSPCLCLSWQSHCDLEDCWCTDARRHRCS